MKRNKKRILLIDAFVSRQFGEIVTTYLRAHIGSPRPLISVFTSRNNDIACQFPCVPIILCENKEKLRSLGVSAPREFILDAQGFLQSCQPCCAFERRISQIGQEICFDEFRAWFVGLFRRYCFQDEHVHGGSQLLNIPDVSKEDIIQGKRCKKSDVVSALKKKCEFKKDEFDLWSSQAAKNEARWLYQRFDGDTVDVKVSTDPLFRFACLINVLFREEHKKISIGLANCRSVEHSFTNWGNAWKQFKAIVAECLYWVVHDPNVGLPIRYLSPTKKINLLLIDDDEDSRAAIRKILGNEASVFNEIFNFDVVNLNVASKDMHRAIPDFIEVLKEKIASGRTYEAVMLDLSLGENPGSDLMGYHLIKRVKQFMPQVPVIIYSRFDDMGHVVRALKNGASWFLRKRELYKLPRHIFSLFSLLEWRKEWVTICESGLCEFKPEDPASNKWNIFSKQFNDKRKYLTYKCLENYPGCVTYIRPMGAGFSTAATFQAVKGAKCDGRSLQTPVIIKIDNVYNTRLEFERYFRFIRPYIANSCGRVENPERVLDDENAAIVYTFAGRQESTQRLVSMKDSLNRDIQSLASCSYERYEEVFDTLLGQVLKRIHCISPAVEFCDSDVAFNDVSRIDLSQYSDFPNRVFGEFATSGLQSIYVQGRVEITPADALLANYICRMPVCRELRLGSSRFLEQSNGDFDANVGKGVSCYEFHYKHKSNGSKSEQKCVIEAFDRADKCTVVMTGDNVDHVVRFRPHTYPCMTLWVEKSAGKKLVVEAGIETKIVNAVGNILPAIPESKRIGVFACFVKAFLGALPIDQDLGLKNNAEGNWFRVCSEIDDVKKTPFNVIPTLLSITKSLLDGELAERLLDCPIGIIHGDLNFANIMLEMKLQHSANDVTGDYGNVMFKDAWLIDFARTRRDFIAHDFNVLFTSTLGLLFDKTVWADCVSSSVNGSQKFLPKDIFQRYALHVFDVFRPFLLAAIFGKLDAVPDVINGNQRSTFVFKMLRRIRRAAISAGMSPESYAITTSMSCLVAARVFLVHEKNAPAAAAMIASAILCLWELEKRKRMMHDS